MEDIQVEVEQPILFKIDPTDAKGVERDVESITWANVGDGVLTPAADGLSATLVPSATPGLNQVTVDADADLTEAGVSALHDSCNVTSVAKAIPQATALNLSAEAVTPEA